MTLDDLIKKLTPDEVKAFLYQGLTDLGINVTSWKPGSPTRTILAVVAAALSGLTELSAGIARSGFLELSDHGWLTLVARYVYGVERDVGSFASGTILFSNSSGFIYSGGPGDLTAKNPSSGATYRNTAAYTIFNGATNMPIPFEAVELGSRSTSVPGDIDELVTPLAGVTLSNPGALVGTDQEDDATLRLRCYEKLGTLSPNGPRDAYAFLARSAKLNGVPAGVTRVRTVADGIGGVDVYVADRSGALTGTVGDSSTKLGVVDEAIQTQAVPNAITARTHSATPKLINVTYELWIKRTSLADADVANAIRQELTKWLGARPIGGHDLGAGGRVFAGAIKTVIGATEGLDDIIEVQVTVPALDVVILPTEAPAIGTITATIHQVDEDVI